MGFRRILMLWSFFWETGKRVFFGKRRKGTFGVFKLRILDIDRKVWNGRMIGFQETMFGQPPGLGILENGLVSGNMEIQILNASDFELRMVYGFSGRQNGFLKYESDRVSFVNETFNIVFF
ncbi:uncharacterized protein OCT59_000272 [Rhizophagus irregularis]|uniref:uncharacterized protein n=1 Tax=Rhizophagus irregularis TaxID=588596 RepID=UPI0033268625|nr:hypothetical protein OCT59_000272 [Rhizophagus irregularis]